VRPDDFFAEDPFTARRYVDRALLRAIGSGPLSGRDDVEVAVPLARLDHDDLEAFGTGGGVPGSKRTRRP
jgi:hypothetical protein